MSSQTCLTRPVLRGAIQGLEDGTIRAGIAEGPCQQTAPNTSASGYNWGLSPSDSLVSAVRPVLANPEDSSSAASRQPLPGLPDSVVDVSPAELEAAAGTNLQVTELELSAGTAEGKREEQAPLHAVRPFGSSPAGPDAWYFSHYDQGTLAGFLLVAALAMIGWSSWQVATLRTRLIDIDRARRTDLRFAVDLNTASAAELANLPGVGPKLAAAIVNYREQSGGFHSTDQLLNVSGIGTAKFQAMLPYLRRLAPATAGESPPEESGEVD